MEWRTKLFEDKPGLFCCRLSNNLEYPARFLYCSIHILFIHVNNNDGLIIIVNIYFHQHAFTHEIQVTHIHMQDTVTFTHEIQVTHIHMQDNVTFTHEIQVTRIHMQDAVTLTHEILVAHIHMQDTVTFTHEIQVTHIHMQDTVTFRLPSELLYQF